jgi:hypothetical protein
MGLYLPDILMPDTNEDEIQQRARERGGVMEMNGKVGRSAYT